MSELITVVNIAGLGVFAALLWSSRARVVGIVAFALPLATFMLHRMRPRTINMDSLWYQADQLAIVLTLVSYVLLLGAVYALRLNASLDSAVRERRVLNAVGTLLIPNFAYASLFARWFYLADQVVVVVVLLLAVSGTLIRWGKTRVGLAGAIGFALLAVKPVLRCLDQLMTNGKPLLPFEVTQGLVIAGLLAVVGSFALASQDSAIQQKPYPGVETLGMNRPRWVGLVLVVLGPVLFLALDYLIAKEGIVKGLHGKAVLLVVLLPALGLYLTVVGAARLTTGRAAWAQKDL